MAELISKADAIANIRDLYPSEPYLKQNRKHWAEKFNQCIRAEKAVARTPRIKAIPEETIKYLISQMKYAVSVDECIELVYEVCGVKKDECNCK